MKAKLIHDKGDVVAVNAARVSMNKHHPKFEPVNDRKLLAYLASHHHWTPFSHIRHTFDDIELNMSKLTPELLTGMVWCVGVMDYTVRHSIYGWYQLCASEALCESDRERIEATLAYHYPECYKVLWDVTELPTIPAFFDLDEPEPPNDYFIDYTLREEVPIYVARQRFKHMVGFTYNEISRRYVDVGVKYYNPEAYRSRPPKSIKQGSGDGVIENIAFPSKISITPIPTCVEASDSVTLALYNAMVKDRVAPEIARGELPQKTYTQYYVTGNLASWKRAYKQRSAPDAQKEIRDLAALWAKEIPDVKTV